MSDAPETPAPETPSTPPQTPPPPPTAEGPSVKELDEGKLFAILSYAINIVGVPFWIAPLVMKNNEFALYHAKQAAFLWIAGLVLGIAGVILFLVLGMIFFPLACIAQIALVAIGIASLVLNILGIVNAIGLKSAPLPVVGDMALSMFKGVTKKA